MALPRKLPDLNELTPADIKAARRRYLIVFAALTVLTATMQRLGGAEHAPLLAWIGPPATMMLFLVSARVWLMRTIQDTSVLAAAVTLSVTCFTAARAVQSGSLIIFGFLAGVLATLYCLRRELATRVGGSSIIILGVFLQLLILILVGAGR